MTTERQKAAVEFCYEWGCPKYNDDIENFKQVSNYLSKYLNKAKYNFEQYKEEILWEDFMINCGDIGINDIY